MASLRSSDIPDDTTAQPITDTTPPKNRDKRRTTTRTAYRAPISPKSSLYDSRKDYQDKISGMLQIVGAAVFPVAPADAAAIVIHSENVSTAVADLAITDDRIARILDKLLEIGPYGALLQATMPLIAQILANHGLIKPGSFGSVTPQECVQAVVGPLPNENKENGHASTKPSVDIPT